jgi:hypothetical protein
MSGLIQAIAERDVWQRRYEQLRQAIDGGSESMTHEDALAEIRDLRASADRTEDAAKLALDRCKFALTKACYLDPDGPEEGGWDDAIEFLLRPAHIAQANGTCWRGWAEAINKAFAIDSTPTVKGGKG